MHFSAQYFPHSLRVTCPCWGVWVYMNRGGMEAESYLAFYVSVGVQSIEQNRTEH
ncbi:uncharacterized protein LY79DRAFT_542461, partial [Colletotrichum navitas]